MAHVSIEDLQAQNRMLAQQLVKREVDEAKAKEAARDAALKAAAAKDATDKLAADAAEIDATRRNAWLQHFCKEHPQDFFTDVIARAGRETPAFSWPPGQSATDYGFGYAAGKLPDDVSQTSMFKMAQKRGVKF